MFREVAGGMQNAHDSDAVSQDTVEYKMCHIGDTSQTRPNLVPFLPQHLVGRQRSEDTFKSQQMIIGLSLPEFEGCVGMDVHQIQVCGLRKLKEQCLRHSCRAGLQ